MNHVEKAILAVSFGTSRREACDNSITAIERALAGAFPDWEVRRAFTSGIIRRKLKDRDGIHTDSVRQALDKLLAEGCAEVLLQPSYVLNGVERDGIVKTAAEYQGRFRLLAVGDPLLTAPRDYHSLALGLGRIFPRREKTTVCLMGHGTPHYAGAAYAALEHHFLEQGREDIRVGALEGYPDLHVILRRISEQAAEKVLLAPLLVTAGEHVLSDMAGEGDSWKAAFLRAGYSVECVLKGLGEYHEIRELYVAHAAAAIDRMRAGKAG